MDYKNLKNLAARLSFPFLAALLLASASSLQAQTGSAIHQLSPTAAAKMQADVRDHVARQLATHGVTRILIRIKSEAEPAANLRGMQARSRSTQALRKAAIRRLVSQIRSKLSHTTWARAESFANVPYLAMEVTQAELEELAGLPEVVEVFEDKQFQPLLNTSIPQIGADLAHLDGHLGTGQAVAVLDTGVDSLHPAFAGKQVTEACFSTTSTASSSFSLCPAGSNPQGADEQVGPGAADACTGMLGCDHGTHVAGIALSADSTFGGVAPSADLIAVQVFSGLNDLFACGFLPPCLSAFTSDVVRALDWVYEQRDAHDIAAVNLSLGAGLYTTQAECDAAFPGIKTAIDNLSSVGIATVVASGNDGVAGALSSPACISGAISVGAVDGFDEITGFANTSDYLTVLTPGLGITSSVPGGGFASKDGTSMAAPHGAGAVAVLKSAVPEATVEEIVAAFTNTGVIVIDPIGGYAVPRIQLDAAVDELRGPMLSDVNLAFELFAPGFVSPVAITHAGDGSGRVFVAQQDGRVFIVHADGSIGAQPFLDVSAEVQCCTGHSGLTGLAFHPDYATNGALYVAMVDSSGDIAVERYTISADPDAVDLSSAAGVLTLSAAGGSHYGGKLQFGPDGYLYIGFGDASLDGVIANTAGDPATLLGKIVRIDVDGGAPYAIPVDNPFVADTGVLDEIWAIGFRDPGGLAFDRLTGDLFIADRGEPDTAELSFVEEINVQAFDSVGGEDYGWSVMNGSQCLQAQACNPATMQVPVAEYDHSQGCAVTGGTVYRGAEHETLQGVVFYGDLCSGDVWGLLHDGVAWQSQRLRSTSFEISAFGEDELGNVYAADKLSGDVYLLKHSDLSLDTQALPNAVMDRSYAVTLAASGGAQPYQWSITDGVLPPGLGLDPGTGEIQGTPLALGVFTFSVELRDAELSLLTAELELTVTTPPPVIQTTVLADADVGEPYAASVQVIDGTPPLVWSVASGTLPVELSLDSVSGTISGVPTTVGSSAFTVTVTDANGLSDSVALTIEVREIVELTVGVLETGQYGHQYGSNNHKEELIAVFTGGTEDLMLDVDGYDIDYADEVLVSLNGVALRHLSAGANNGLNGGDSLALPLALQVAGENTLSFRQVRSVGFIWGVTNLLLDHPIGPPIITSTSLPNGLEDAAYSATLAVTDGLAPLSWEVSSGSLPPGVTLSTDGDLSGTPTQSGTFNFEVRVTDGLSRTDVQALTLIVNSLDIALTVGLLETGQYGHQYGASQHLEQLNATFSGGAEDLMLSVDGYDIDYPDEVQVLLNGVSLGFLSTGPNNALNGGDTLGVPRSQQVAGENTLTFRQARSVGFIWGVTNILLDQTPGAPVITTSTLPNAVENSAYAVTLSATGGVPPLTWRVSAGALPAGLVLSAAGELSGTPTEQGSFGFEVEVSDGLARTDVQALSLTVSSLDVALTVGVLETGQYGHNYGSNAHQVQLIATFDGGTEELVLYVDGYDIDYADEVEVSLNGFPLAHLSPGANNGLNGGDSVPVPLSMQIAGENTLSFKQVRSVGFTWGVTNILLASASAPPVIATQSLPEAFEDAAFTHDLEATGGTSPYTWSVTGGTLPQGISLSTAGTLSGTPTEAGSFQFEVEVSDASSETDVETLTLTVSTLDVTLNVGELETGQYGHNYGTNVHLEELVAKFTNAGSDLSLSVDGFDVDFANEVLVSLNGTSLGYLSVGPNNGLNAGDTFIVPLSQQLPGENELSFKQARSVGYKWGVTNLLLQSFSGPPVISTETLPDGLKDAVYPTTSLMASGGSLPYSWSVSAGALPAGLVLSADGEISGTPSEAGVFSFEVQVTDGDSAIDTQALALSVTSLDVELSIGVLDTGKYGNKYGTNQHQTGIPLVFTNVGADLVLTLNGYDIDYTDEVSVSLNRAHIGFLRKGANNGLNAGDTFTLPSASLIPGTNTVRLNQERNPTFKWGATNLLLNLAN